MNIVFKNTSVTLTPSSIILLLTFFINLSVGIYILSKDRKKINIILGICSLEVALWNITNLLAFSLTSFYWVNFFTRLALAVIWFAPSVFLHIALEFTQSRFLLNRRWLLYLPPLLTEPLMLAKLNIIEVTTGTQFIPGVLYLVIVISFSVSIIIGSFLLVTYYNRVNNVIIKHQIQYILLGILISSITGTFTNAVLPYFLHQKVIIEGTSTSIAFGLLTTYAITRYRLLGITFVLKQWLVELLGDIITIALAIGTIWIIWPFPNGQLLFVIVLAVIITIYARCIRYFLTKHNLLNDTTITIPEELSFSQPSQIALEQAINHLQQYLQTKYEINQPVLCLLDWKTRNFQTIQSDKKIWFNQNHALVQFCKLYSTILVKDEIDTQAYHLSKNTKTELQSFMNMNHLAFAIPLFTEMDIYGFVFIHKNEQSRFKLYSKNNLHELEMLGKKYGQLFQQALIYDAMISKNNPLYDY